MTCMLSCCETWASVGIIVDAWTQEKSQIPDDRNYSSLADEFDMAAGTEAGTADELIRDDDDDDGVSTVRRRVTTSLADSMWYVAMTLWYSIDTVASSFCLFITVCCYISVLVPCSRCARWRTALWLVVSVCFSVLWQQWLSGNIPLWSDRQHRSYDVCLEVRGKIIRTVLCCIVYWSCAQS